MLIEATTFGTAPSTLLLVSSLAAAHITTYLVKILALLFLVAKYIGTTAFNGKLFGLTVVVCVVAWTTSQALVAAKLKVPYVEPDGQLKVPYAEPDGKR